LRIMSAKRISSLGAMIVLLALSLVGGGCATTSSQTASGAKPHKAQMITANGPEEVGESPFMQKTSHGFDLSDEVATIIAVLGFPLRMLCGNSYSWRP